ncbi:MAG TPA: hypothetical protein VF438_03195 [Candidatus Paceibacterota bacterium]
MNFIIKSLIKRQLKGVPEDQIDMIVNAIEKDPEFFKTLAEKIKGKMAQGMSEQQAAQAIMQEHGEELKQKLGT